MRAERTFHNRYEFDLEMIEIHEWPARRERLLPRACGYGSPRVLQSAAKGISIRPLAGADPRMARSMSIRARSTTGTRR
jgi:hypothetical protein